VFLAILRVITPGVVLVGAGTEAAPSPLSSWRLLRLSSRLLFDHSCGLADVGVASASYCNCLICCLWPWLGGWILRCVLMPFITVYYSLFSWIKPWFGGSSMYPITGSVEPCCSAAFLASMASLHCRVTWTLQQHRPVFLCGWQRLIVCQWAWEHCVMDG
jgi:hypothetical protein